MKRINLANLLKIGLVCILMLASAHSFGQANSASHSKKKVSVSPNSRGPSLKETVQWIADKLNRYAISPATYQMKGDTMVMQIENLNFSFKITNDTIFYYWRVQIFYAIGNTAINAYDTNGNRIDGLYHSNILVPMKDITDVGVISMRHYYQNFKDTSSGYAKELRINGNNMKTVNSDNPKDKYHFLAMAYAEIPIDFSKEKNLEERMIKAFNHLKTFYNQPEVKPKVKEAF